MVMEAAEPSPPQPPRKRRLGRRFQVLWATFGFTSLGDGFIYGAVPLLAVVVDPHPVAVSTVVAANSLPWLLLGVHAGALADRFERARVMALSNLFRALVLAAMTAVIAMHTIDLLLLIVLVLAEASGRAVYYAASQAALPELIEQRDFTRANGILFGTEAATENLAGPVFGTMIFSIAQSLPFLSDGIAMTISGFSLLGFRTKRRVAEPAAPRTRMSEGLRHLLGNRDLRVLVSLIASLAGLQGLVTGVIVLVATKDWHVSTSFYGAFVATQAVGNMAGGFLADKVARSFGTVQTVLGAAVLSGLGYFAMSIATGWLWAGVAFTGVGFAVGCGGVVAVSLRQRLTPDDLMGRVTSAWRGLVWGAGPLGALAAGGLAVAGGLRLPLYLAAGLQLLAACVLARPLVRAIAAVERTADVPETGAPAAPV